MAPRRVREPNLLLAQLLAEAGWSPGRLARKINAVLGAGTVAETAPYHWRDAGAVPRPPLPDLTARLLGDHLGRTVLARDLWGRDREAIRRLPEAADGLVQPFTRDGLDHIVETWVAEALTDRHTVLAATGAGLLAAVAVYLDATVPAPRGRTGAHPDLPAAGPLVDQVEAALPLLQQLDDEQGGARHLPYVGAQMRAVALLIKDGGHRPHIETRLIQALAEIGQLAGWMAFDADRHGLAQRYFISALHAADAVADRALAAHILADLAFQAASRNHAADARALNDAAERSARAADQARTLLDAPPQQQVEPRWMYYLSPSHLNAQTGYALICLGRAQLHDGARPAAARRALRRGTALLATGAHNIGPTTYGQRRALYEGAWLALGQLAAGELEAACATAEGALARLERVNSPRSASLLAQLHNELTRRTRNPFAADFAPRLGRALDLYHRQHPAR
ncbi:hypothetical protein BIV57_13230 [Mangrovactinospora gilvigrisea]|uniref:Transcriptional regulator n=1 Tax=Mangrovactinospora gilvigrisea TaxID=1428644 RepID=A0A1J7BE92_9ACTN|nr:hypothetical protein [Mangrovactinospora gilvigrisea]OIV36950.1 hypothetical protein BIV57_13230 [Mangrovactinospora gilvigrisea]